MNTDFMNMGTRWIAAVAGQDASLPARRDFHAVSQSEPVNPDASGLRRLRVSHPPPPKATEDRRSVKVDHGKKTGWWKGRMKNAELQTNGPESSGSAIFLNLLYLTGGSDEDDVEIVPTGEGGKLNLINVN